MELDIHQISKVLTTKEATNNCHRCNRSDFTILNGYTIFGLQDTTSGIVLGGRNSVPVINVVCNHCGAITSHAVGVLGLLDNDKGNKDGK